MVISISKNFGTIIAELVVECTDDKRLPNAERKLLQIEPALSISDKAKRIEMTDKIAQITDIMHNPPKDYDWDRKK